MKFLIKTTLVIASIFVVLIFISFFMPDDPETINNSPVKKIAVFVDEEPNNPQNQKQIKIAIIEVNSLNSDLITNILVNDAFNIKRLEKAVAEIKNRPGLKLMVENYEMINGEESLVMKEIGVLKTDSNYIYAVREALTIEFGLKAEIEK